ncbi:hypothetical protein DM860_003411 [Cuscuta australis]|uniref:GTD-binding domain-containing protein n=1 Tax=Cuscuta australis TaxID=267555 RepID=A0A328DFP7_9ASTE|nr:hypothetical protein DM860_003411 [Cuscuta australis]
MDSESEFSLSNQFKCCDCGCSCALVNVPVSGTWLRSVKRKQDECDDAMFKRVLPQTARVDAQDECVALREMVCSQQVTIQDLRMELDEERSAACSAANEAMSMILRLQREKSEIQMEFRQFKRFTEEKIAHDQQELAALENILYMREQTIHSLACDMQLNKHSVMSCRFTEAQAEAVAYKESGHLSWNDNKPEMSDGEFEFPPSSYPVIKCFNQNHVDDYDVDNGVVDVEEHVSREIPPSQDQLRDLEYRINQLEKSPGTGHRDVAFYENDMIEKVIIRTSLATNQDADDELVAQSPESGGSLRKIGVSESKECPDLKEVKNITEVEDADDTAISDRVYTIDSVYQGTSYNGVTDPKTFVEVDDMYTTNPRDSLNHTDLENPDVIKLYARLQSLEADRESMRQTIITMQTEKAQLVLLKEIAQQLCKDISPARRAHVRKPSITWSFSFISVFKWIVPSFFWRKRARRYKYTFGMPSNCPGLLLLLYKGPLVGHWRCLTSTQV